MTNTRYEKSVKRNAVKFTVVVLCLFFGLAVSAQSEKAGKKVKILPVPTIGYSPETKTYLGAVSLFTLDFYQDSLTRLSNADVEITYTWNKQLILESNWNYFFKEERWYTEGKLHFSDYPDLYYGIGSESPEKDELSFESKRVAAELSVLKNIGRNWFVGPALKYISYSDVEAIDEQPNFNELQDASNFGVGLSLLKDSRNSILTPTTGLYFYVNATHNLAKSDYQEFTIDARYYHTWKQKFTLATRVLNDFTTGTPPFYDYAMLGGDKYVRGYYLGRYRDNNLSTIQTEFRLPIYGRLHLATFAGVSNLYSAKNNFALENTRLNYGAGLRFLVDKTGNTFLRMDYAAGGDNNSGFYISFGESF